VGNTTAPTYQFIPMSAHILGFSGSIGSGKSTLSIELAGRINYKYASFGNYVRKAATQMGYIDPSRAQLQEIGEMLVENGDRKFCLSVLRDAEWLQGEGLIVDGIRHLDILELQSDICQPQKVFLIYMTVDEDVRRARLISRGRDKELTSALKHSTELQVKEILRSKADLVIDGSKMVNNNLQHIIAWLATKL